MSSARQGIALLVSDVDGTLVRPDKSLSPATVTAVAALRAAGIAFAVVSSRPPRGLAMLVEPLGLTTPLCGFNGGLIVDRAGARLADSVIPPDAVQRSLALFAQHGVETWLFDDTAWYVRDPDTAFCARERHTVRFAPTVVADFDTLTGNAYKIVGASDDHAGLAACEAALHQAALGDTATAARSQPYYLDVTARQADKGQAVAVLSRLLSVPRERVAVIGDGRNDIAMFGAAGFAVAMGNAAPETKAAAAAITGSNEEDGFAAAVARYILGNEAQETR